MRLTLRTLLAYVDDTLEPKQAREIGQKVAESAPARELIERIRQVVRRRRLGAPPILGGSEFDANMAAQYLDGSLPDDDLTQFEEKCLADDQLLAEVASCHQILALVLGESANVPPKARERMYELVRDPAKAARRRAAMSRRVLVSNSAPAHDETDEKLLLGLPRSQPSGGLSFWTFLVAGCLLVGAAVALWMSMGNGRRELAQLGTSAETEKPEKNLEKVQKAPETAAQSPEQPKENSAVAEAVKQPTVPANPPHVQPTPTTPATEKTENRPPATPVVERPPINAKPGTRRFEMGTPTLIAGVPNLLLEKAANQSSWTRLPPEKSKVWATDELLALPGYRSEVRFASGIDLVLWGSLPELTKSNLPVLESAVTINSQPGIDLDLTLERGRVLLSSQKKDGPVVARIRFAGEVWDVTLNKPETEVGVELLAACLPYSTKTKETRDIDVALLVFKGEASLKAGPDEYLLQPNTIVTWDNASNTTSKPGALPKLPDWYLVKNGAVTGTAGARESNLALEALGRISTTKTIDVALAECLHANDAATRVLAVRSLAAIGDRAGLVSALGDEKHPDMRAAAVDGLRHLLAVDPEAGSNIEQAAKERGLSARQIVTLRQLLQGFDDQQWSDAAVRTSVVDFLLHDKLMVRQLAISLLLRRYPEGQRIGYDAGADVRKRERACEEWKAIVQPPQKK